MPDTGTQIILCNLPIRFDTYSGCMHGCRYCFANQRGRKIKKVKKNEGPDALENFINGKRNPRTKWCDWNIPLHWGGLSDPFQPIELLHRSSYKCLLVFKDKKYPFVFSTKSDIVSKTEYLKVIKECNCVGQVSLVSPQYDIIEPKAPPYGERLKTIKSLSNNCLRVIVRVQPYQLSVHEFLLGKGLRDMKNAGAYGITIEGFKSDKIQEGFIRVAGDYVYPKEILKEKFLEIKKTCESLRLHFFSAENRLRDLGESTTCCGCEDLDGFKVNKANLNEYYFGSREIEYTERMGKKETGGCFAPFVQSWEYGQYTLKVSYKELMEKSKEVKNFYPIFN